MNSIQIHNLLSHNKYTKKYFAGVYPADQLPHNLNETFKNKPIILFVANYSSSRSPGSHWIGICVSRSPRTIEVFDTAGDGLSFKSNKYFQNFIERNRKTKNGIRAVLYNKAQLQSLTSTLCGQFTCLYVLARSRGSSFNLFLNLFDSNNMVANDNLALTLFNKYFPIDQQKTVVHG